MVTSIKYKNCEVVIGKIKTLTNLIKLREIEFDVILGMDWLSTYRAHVD